MHHLLGMIIFVLLYGMFLGTPDTLSNVMLIKVFGKEVTFSLDTLIHNIVLRSFHPHNLPFLSKMKTALVTWLVSDGNAR